MNIINFNPPYEKIQLVIIKDFKLDNKLLSEFSKKFQPETLIFPVPREINPCALALVYSYVMEDFMLNKKISNLSLRAILYLTKSKQISDAIERTSNFNDMVIVSVNKEKLINALKSINYDEMSFENTIYDCKDLNEFTEINTFRLTSLNI